MTQTPPAQAIKLGNTMSQFKDLFFNRTASEAAHYLVYGIGNNPARIIFHEDSGHGWLEIPKFMAKELSIVPDITPFSYQNTDSYFLEEDSDMSLFFKAVEMDYDQGDAIKELRRRIFWETVPKTYAEDSHIRNMRPAAQRENKGQLKFNL